jgi:hypothetical protein
MEQVICLDLLPESGSQQRKKKLCCLGCVAAKANSAWSNGPGWCFWPTAG